MVYSLAVLSVILIIFTGISLYMYNYAIKSRPNIMKVFAEDEPNWLGECHSWLKTKEIEDITIKSFDGLNLYSKYIPAKIKTDRTAIIIHGYTSEGVHMCSFAKYYSDQLNWNVLMPDLRGHGQSEGKYVGFGWHDRLDILKWIKKTLELAGQNAQIVLHGVSMGAATALMTSGEDLPGNVKFIIADCSYTSLQSILSYQIKQMFKLPPFPLIPLTSLICWLRNKYSFKEVSSLEQLRKSKIPVLFIHGGNDTFVPINMVYELRAVTAGDNDLVIVPGATHALSFWVDPDRYVSAINGFIQKYIN